MTDIKHYGGTDLYDPDRPAGQPPTIFKLDPIALGKSARAWMQSRRKNKTEQEHILHVSTNYIFMHISCIV